MLQSSPQHPGAVPFEAKDSAIVTPYKGEKWNQVAQQPAELPLLHFTSSLHLKYLSRAIVVFSDIANANIAKLNVLSGRPDSRLRQNQWENYFDFFPFQMSI